MAYAALVSLSQTLDHILLDHEQQHLIDVHHQQIKTLHENIMSLLTFLDDQFPGEAADLERRIIVAANQAEDIIEYRIFDGLILSPDPNWQQMLCQALNKSFKKFDYILKKVNQILKSIKDPNSISAGSFPSRPAPTIGKVPVVGLDQDLIEIKERLCGEPSKLHLIPIVGMGGIGKTTLARYAYDDPLTLHHFDVRVWVTVSQENSARGVLLDILRSIDPTKKKLYNDGELVDEYLLQLVYQYLKGRRYVIVMDDVWSRIVWDELRRVFPDDVNGSRIVITTRLLEVASYVDSSTRPYEMHLMDVEQGWCLFKEKIFGERENCPSGLEHIGRIIVENCQGLPLAIVMIAGMLSNTDRTQESWANIARNVKTVLKNNASDDRFSKILSLSYAYLPHYLRPCFLYMGCFPEDHEINVSKLFKLWAAEGFLRSNGTDDLEELAEECLEDLVKRSLVLVSRRKYNGRIKSVMIHDLLRDLCISKARDEKFVHVISEFRPRSAQQGIIDQSSRRLSILEDIFVEDFRNTNGLPIHTILIFKEIPISSWRSFRLLRVLDALKIKMRSYPDKIFELFHLRYLAFTFEPDDLMSLEYEVPESLSKLRNLQTLIISFFTFDQFDGTILNLPFRIWRMPQLRHLILSDGYLPDPSEGVTSVLENLHTLSRLERFTCSEKMCEMMPNLRKLRIHYWWKYIYETGWSTYGLTNLVHLHKLEELKIDGESYPNFGIRLNKNLIAFPLTLNKLTLRGCQIPWKEMTIVGSLPSLGVLKLKESACHGVEWKTNEGEFSRLKVLLIEGTDLHQWVAESGHFPRLERLVLYRCYDLREIPSCIGEIATLQVIEVDARNLSVVESARRIEDEQQSFGNDIRVCLLKSRY